jgi:hypothetical protein
MEMRKTAAMAACGLAVACLAGCGSPSSAVGTEPMVLTSNADEPKWVSAGAGAFPKDAGKAFYGVGIAAANRFPADPFMLRETATEHGRAEVAAQLQIMVAAVLTDYAAAAFAPGMKPDEMQGMTENVQQSVADATLSGAEPVASWKDPQTGAMYVLIRLSLEDAARQIRDQIIAVETDKLKMDAAAAHKELDGIIEKNRPRPAK